MCAAWTLPLPRAVTIPGFRPSVESRLYAERNIAIGGAMHTVLRFRPFGLLAFIVAACLLLSGCGIFDQKPAVSSQTVGDNGADLTVAGVHIVVPAGAVPVGTKVEASFEDHSPSGADPDVKTLAQAFKIRLGDGLEPSKPLTVTVPVDKGQLIAQQGADTATTVAMMVQSEGASAPDLVKGTWDPAAGTITAQVPHLSWVWPVQIDLGAVMNNVRTFIMQGLKIEYRKPDCVDKPVAINGTTYKAVSPAQVWLCVGESNGALTVTASPNSPIPFLAVPTPSAEPTTKTEVNKATAFAVGVADNSGFTKKHQALVMPGVDAEFAFDGAPADDVAIGFSQYPAMLLVSILAEVFDVALGHYTDSKALEAIEKADCMQNVVDTSQAGKPLSPEVAAGVVKSFFACAGSMAKLSLPGQIILAILGAGPQFLVASALGIINEFTGGSNFSGTVTAMTLAAPATKFVTLDPWHDGSLSKVTETHDAGPYANAEGARCNGSEIAVRSDGFRCYWPGIFDPCFQSPTTPTDFLCVTTGSNGGMVVTRLENMILGDDIVGLMQNKGAPDQAPPVRIQLADGTVCARSTGAGPQGVPGYPYWAGFCVGPSAGVWRVDDSHRWNNDMVHYTLFPGKTAGRWQAAVSVGSETAPAKLLDVVTVWR